MSDESQARSAPDVMASLQESNHGEGHDYFPGSPHLRHVSLRRAVNEEIHSVVRGVIDRQGTCYVLEVGAGHGTFTDVALSAGATVTVTEMSAPSASLLARKYGSTPGVTILYDPDGAEVFRRGVQYDVVLFISVLHHIPDYLQLVEKVCNQLIRPGGALVSFQDPLWYPRQGRGARAASWLSYLAWRIPRGHFRRGIATRLRHVRGTLDTTNPSDMVEYHVVRQGVDDVALAHALDVPFRSVVIHAYWSTQSPFFQAVGARFFPANTFGLVATGRVESADNL